MHCKSCGASFYGNVASCPSCGSELTYTGQLGSEIGTVILPNETTGWLARRVQANGFLWLLIALYQIIAGIFLIAVGYGIPMLACGLWNIVQSIKDFRFAKQIRTCDNHNLAQSIVQVIDRSKSNTILFLFINLFLGGVLGVIGCIFWLALRSRVLDRAPELGVYD